MKSEIDEEMGEKYRGKLFILCLYREYSSQNISTMRFFVELFRGCGSMGQEF